MSTLPPRVACITMAYNESDFLPLWVSYYGAQFGRENLFIIDDGSNDGSTVIADVNVIKIPKVAFNDERKAKFISGFHAALLNYYDLGIFVDTDEFLVAEPKRYASLSDYCARGVDEAVTALGLNVYQLLGEEAPLDWSRPIFEQRRYAKFVSSMCKTAVSRGAIIWGPGFHGSLPKPPIDDSLYLFHLKHVDFERSFRRQEITRDLVWDEVAIKRNYGRHQRESDAWLEKHWEIHATVPSSGPGTFEFGELIAEAESGRNARSDGVASVASNVRGGVVRIPESFVGKL